MQAKKQSELKKIYGIELPIGKYKIIKDGDYYKIYTIKDDTEGCILVGFNKEKGKVLHSRVTFTRLMNKIKPMFEMKEKIELEIV